MSSVINTNLKYVNFLKGLKLLKGCNLKLLVEFYQLFDYKNNNNFSIRRWHKKTAVDYFLLNIPVSNDDWNHMLCVTASDFKFGSEPEIYNFELTNEFIIFSNFSFKSYSYKKLHEWYQKWITTVTKEFKYFEVLKYEKPLIKKWTVTNDLNQIIEKQHKFFYVIKSKIVKEEEKWNQFKEALLFNRYLRDTLYESKWKFSWTYY